MKGRGRRVMLAAVLAAGCLAGGCKSAGITMPFDNRAYNDYLVENGEPPYTCAGALFAVHFCMDHCRYSHCHR